MDKTRKSESLLSQVQEGMVVFDFKKQRVGAITDIYFDTTHADPNEPLSPAFAFEDEIPASVRARLLIQGFLRVSGEGFLPAIYYYVTPDQLASLDVGEVFLSVTSDQLGETNGQ